jgi:hypothetical protein
MQIISKTTPTAKREVRATGEKGGISASLTFNPPPNNPSAKKIAPITNTKAQMSRLIVLFTLLPYSTKYAAQFCDKGCVLARYGMEWNAESFSPNQ